ncbi:glycine cleavage system protein GcvH [Candidatus Fermentibacteria bacterium]|nr:glycine cleavage system protein GcvH [Candidatus Fermentibacteria bacterium]
MSEIPEDLRFAETHEWVRDDGDGKFTMGITDHAQSEMGEIVMIELPSVGDQFDSGDVVGTLEAVKTAADFYAPLGGKVTEVNESLEDSPEKINQDPYGEGWLVSFESDDGEAVSGLMSAAEYRQHAGD